MKRTELGPARALTNELLETAPRAQHDAFPTCWVHIELDDLAEGWRRWEPARISVARSARARDSALERRV